jgi:hypothetical protein
MAVAMAFTLLSVLSMLMVLVLGLVGLMAMFMPTVITMVLVGVRMLLYDLLDLRHRREL